jgi:Protein of unknown function (DUF3375)
VLSLRERSFIGTESRLLTFVDLVRQMAEESDPDVERRLAILHKQRQEVDEKIARVSRGEVDVLSDFELRDRFQQITQLAHGLLADFREVEENFRKLSRSARERIALWDGSKGDLLEELWRSRDEISDSDQGRSFGAFCDFLLSVSSREELSLLMSAALRLPAVREQAQDSKLDRVHYDWISTEELALLQKLQIGAPLEGVRLEQEKISYSHVAAALVKLLTDEVTPSDSPEFQ